jgi:putative NAD(P)-binding protein
MPSLAATCGVEGCSVGGNRYDVMVIGGGHNGLTSAAYLARAGLSTLVLERRDLVGGACVTEEIAPGVRASTTSYIASMLRPEVIRELRLADHGLRMVPCEPGSQAAFEDGDVFPWWSELERTAGSSAGPPRIGASCRGRPAAPRATPRPRLFLATTKQVVLHSLRPASSRSGSR